ncbi:thioredoxin domain [Bacillus phage TsarBomba]|uniref:Thioredoxin n=1 Tax=Bacillus phage TsarBomba TaxID=1690456 RepID=A0A0K2D052_9CAUD|nr:thioredoxin domain [Bacillus phage TsarBomba]ALA13037.1 thioredoxin [Bacillus phage TsarBomba]
MQIIKFENEGCNPCKAVGEYLDREVKEYRVIDAFKEPREAAKFDIGSVPTVILLDDNDVEVKRSVGFKPAELEEIIELLEGE